MRELNTCTSCKFKITGNKFGFLKQWDKTEIMLKTHQNKSEETAKCRFLIKYKVEVKVSQPGTQDTKGKGNNR